MSLPPVETPLGAMRFNSDSHKLEYFNGDVWMQVHTFNPDLDGGPRGLFMGGNNGSNYNDINYANLASQGNAIDFGNLQANQTAGAACCDRTRSLYGGGQWPSSFSAHMMKVTIASLGDAVDFNGDLSEGRDFLGSLSNATRGIWAGGRKSGPSTATDTIDYVTIQTTGNAKDFGNLQGAQLYYPMCLASPTRGIVGNSNNNRENDIDLITIASKGAATEFASDFGDLTVNKGGSGCSNAIRGIFSGGYLTPAGTLTNGISYITIATQGNSSEFGDLTRTVRGHGACASSIRGVFSGGKQPGNSKTIDYVTIATTGNANDFGDLVGGNSGERGNVTSCSNAHGGLG